MRVLLVGDIHLKGGWDSEEAQALKKIAELVREIRPDRVILLGDVFDADSTPIQRLIFKRFLAEVNRQCPAIVIRGNHDKRHDLMAFESGNVSVSEVPTSFDSVELNVCCVPHCNPAKLAEEQLGLDDVTSTGTEFIGYWLEQMANRIRTEGTPSLIVFHGEVDGAQLDSGYVPRHNGIHLPKAVLETIPCPVIGGHYHKHQRVAKNVWYAGSITRNNYGEAEGDKGVMLFTHDGGEWLEPEFISLNPPKMVHINAKWTETGWSFEDTDELADFYYGCKVRFRYEVEQSLIPLVDIEAIERHFSQALDLKIERVVMLKTASRSPEITKSQTVEESLRVWLKNKSLDAEAEKAVIETYRQICLENEESEDVIPFGGEPEPSRKRKQLQLGVF